MSLLGVNEFYNAWVEMQFLRLFVDVRNREQFEYDHAAGAVHFNADVESITEFLEAQMNDNPMVEKFVFYDDLPFKSSEKLAKIAAHTTEGKICKKAAFFLEAGVQAVKDRYPFIWTAEEEPVSYPSLVIPDFFVFGG